MIASGIGGGKDTDLHRRPDPQLVGPALDRSLDKIAVKLETNFPVCVYHLTALATDCKVIGVCFELDS